jgi:glycopeptide antibiotics resistance protein
MKNKRTFLLHLLFVFYLAALTWIILFKMAVSFDTIDHGIRSLNLITNGRINFSEMIDNILVFCPFGIYIGVLYRRWNLSEKVLSFFSVSLIYEVLQYVLAIGRSDITDVIMNTVGGIVGLLIYSLLNKICRNERMTEIVVFICAAFGSAAVSGFLLTIFHAN